MYENLDGLRPDLQPMFEGFKSVASQTLAEVRDSYPECPGSYLEFLAERGSGWLRQDGEFFCFETRLLSAQREFFQDREIYRLGAKGDVMIFGYESMGTAYGFDSGDKWRLVEVDEYRIVTRLDLSFEQFVVGLVLCYPQIAVKVAGDEWIDGVGARYRLSL